jgi:hypothetical protein
LQNSLLRGERTGHAWGMHIRLPAREDVEVQGLLV